MGPQLALGMNGQAMIVLLIVAECMNIALLIVQRSRNVSENTKSNE